MNLKLDEEAFGRLLKNAWEGRRVLKLKPIDIIRPLEKKTTSDKKATLFPAHAEYIVNIKNKVAEERLYGIGRVDKEAIEPRPRELRDICAAYLPDDIYNYDETGMREGEGLGQNSVNEELMRMDDLQHLHGLTNTALHQLVD
ncbi:hypothetical protein BG004_003363 [Podila humilis]|nr:hypothetical protein BG004_003363 [Podila humilis]